MTKARKVIVDLLLYHSDGMTIREIAGELDSTDDNVHHAIKLADRVYIDRWTPHPVQPKRMMAVYCAVPVPEDCPKPEIV
jgi:predicted transcriptional regulator